MCFINSFTQLQMHTRALTIISMRNENRKKKECVLAEIPDRRAMVETGERLEENVRSAANEMKSTTLNMREFFCFFISRSVSRSEGESERCFFARLWHQIQAQVYCSRKCSANKLIQRFFFSLQYLSLKLVWFSALINFTIFRRKFFFFFYSN